MSTHYRQFRAQNTRSRHGGQRRHSAPRPRLANGQQYIDPSRFINKAVVTEVELYTPQHQFSDFQIDEALKKNIAKKGYVTPTPIQDRSIPHILEGSDIVGIANTGTGKTGAFLIPIVNKILTDRTQKALIIVPTRELALQIEEEYWALADHMRIGAVTCVGGANIGRQISTLRRNPNVIIGTPGRLKDLMSQGALDLSGVSTVVLDEADRMLDMGFIKDMKFILSHMQPKRHTLFFSATLSREIELLIGGFLNNPVRISIKTGDTAESIEQDILRLSGKNKMDVLHELLTQPEFSKVIVFGRTKHGVEKLSKHLAKLGVTSEAIHGNKNQNHRQRALSRFKENQVKVLCATDVAARGIDVPDVSHVINFDIPNTYEDYVHRIGRTGRAGKRGIALTFID
jgi:ATP-dependent RNA helicase RhlE